MNAAVFVLQLDSVGEIRAEFVRSPHKSHRREHPREGTAAASIAR